MFKTIQERTRWSYYEFVLLSTLVGVAGLITALELSLSGHTVQVFEASDRLGGRIYTYRTSEGYLTELGAMRLPLMQHKLLCKYILERFKLPVKQFQHYDNDTVVFLNDIKASRGAANLFPGTFHFNVSEREKSQVNYAMKYHNSYIGCFMRNRTFFKKCEIGVEIKLFIFRIESRLGPLITGERSRELVANCTNYF